VFNRRFTTAFGCDSLVTLNLQVIPQVVTEFSETATNQYTWNGHTYTQSGDYVQTFTSAHGCDSTVILHLTIVPVCEAPEGLLAVAEENRVRLSWNSSPAALYYLLFRNGVQIENSIDTISYIDAALEYATHYCYTLKAICEHGESEMSEEACVWTLPDGIGVFTDPIRIFPNPAHTIVSVEYKYLKDIRIYNSIGQLLETVNANGEPGVHISMKNHASGVYIFKIKTVDGYEFSKRVVVEK
ncbi:MAG: T9SS type A sorting domain-containing protein, partial [Bacteroidales bacterium]